MFTKRMSVDTVYALQARRALPRSRSPIKCMTRTSPNFEKRETMAYSDTISSERRTADLVVPNN